MICFYVGLGLFLISFPCAVIYTQETSIENLGVISRRRGILLERTTNRTDFVRFIIELKLAGSSNTVTLLRTNDFLNLDDFGSVPSGPVIMGVKSVYSDGDEDEIELYRLEVRRNAPTRSRARSIQIIGTNAAPDIKNALEHRLRARTNHLERPPLPSGSAFEYPNQGMPMRGGTNKGYAEHMAEMQAHFSRGTRK